MNETHHDALPLRELYRQWNFDPAVFRADEARKEKRLGEVIILPSWFYDVLGDVGNTDFAVDHYGQPVSHAPALLTECLHMLHVPVTGVHGERLVEVRFKGFDIGHE